MLPDGNGGLVATADLSVPEVARRLKLKVDEVLILILAGVLKADSTGQDTFQIREEDLEEFALLIALNLEDKESFADGLGLFVNSVRQALSCAKTPVPVLIRQTQKKAKSSRREQAKGKRIGSLLVSLSVVTPGEVREALAKQRAQGSKKQRLGEILVKEKACGPEDVAKAIALQCGKKYCNLLKLEIDETVIDLVEKGVASQFGIVPVKKGRRALLIATAEPMDYMVLEDMRFVVGFDLDYVIASKDAINDAIAKYYGEMNLDDQFTEMSGMDIQFGGGPAFSFSESPKADAPEKPIQEECKPADSPAVPNPAIETKSFYSRRGQVQELNLEDLDNLRADLAGIVDVSHRDSGRFLQDTIEIAEKLAARSERERSLFENSAAFGGETDSKAAEKNEAQGFLSGLKAYKNEEDGRDSFLAEDRSRTITREEIDSQLQRIKRKTGRAAPSFGRLSAGNPFGTKGKNQGPATGRRAAGYKAQEMEIETVERRTTVRHHKQMYLQQSYPLFVIISQHKIKKLVSVLVDQVSSKKAFKVKKSNPNVRIRPIFPGCLCVPNELDLDVSERIAEAKFFLTPQALGKLEGAKVEILYEGKVVDEIEVDCVATTQALAKLSGSAAFITTSFGPTFESLGKSLSEKGAGWIGELLQMAGSEHGPMITSALLGVMTLLFYLWKKPREAKPIENMFDYEMDSAPQGNPHVMKQKCRLVLLSRAGRQKFELVEEKTTMGRTADCLVNLKERSVAPKHAEINFDPDRQEFSVRPLAGAVRVNGVAVDKVQKLPRDAEIEFSGDVSFWFYDEREDSSGWDRPHIRAKIVQKLLETLGSFSVEIQSAFSDPKNKTTRAALAALMVKGILTPKRWSLIKRAAGNFRS